MATPRVQPSTEKIGAELRLAGPAFPCSQSKVPLSQIQSLLPPNLFPRFPPAPGVQPKHLPEACTPFKWYPDCAPTSSLDILPCVLSTSTLMFSFSKHSRVSLSLSLSLRSFNKLFCSLCQLLPCPYFQLSGGEVLLPQFSPVSHCSLCFLGQSAWQ